VNQWLVLVSQSVGAGIAFHAEVAIYCAFTLTQHWTAIPRGFTDERIYNSTHIFSLQA